MSQSVCLYSELEPYSGSISHNPSDLSRLIWDLKLACLFYDVVIVHRRNIWEHPLTLPAFEILAPFVKSGQLWTSANESDHLPENYVEQKAQQFDEFFGRGYVKKINAVGDIKERWLRIIPAEWKIRRCASEQAAYVLKNIDDYLSQFKDNKFRQLRPLLDLVERMRADNDFNKEETLAWVVKLRHRFHPALLSEIASLIQTEFVRAGAKFNNDAVIYPGNSARSLKITHFEELPFDHLILRQVTERINRVGFNLDELVNLPVPMLFEISQSPQWLIIRNALLKEIFNVEIEQEMRSVFTTNLSFPHKLERLLNISGHFQGVENSTPHLSPIFMPSPWALVSQSLLGSASVAAKDEVKEVGKTFILNLETRVLYNENSQLELTQQQTNLLSMLVIAGKLGLSVVHIKQLCLELDLLRWQTLKWDSQAKQEIEYRNLLRNRIDKLKGNINKKLKPLGLKIAAESGKERWYLEKDFVIKLSSTAWGEISDKKEVNYIPQGLSKQSKVIWYCLWEHSPKFVHAKTIAEILEKEWDEKTKKQIYDAVYKLKQGLKNEPWMIRCSYLGEYALVPRQLLHYSRATTRDCPYDPRLV